jgi:hypothetical protein
VSAPPLLGGCLCGAIRFEITGKPLWMTLCHCSRCRKAGAGVTVTVRARDFRWLSGRELVATYVPEPPFNIERCFCSRCGTPLGEPGKNDRGFPIAANTLDGDPGVRLALHEHVSHKPPWYEIPDDGLPRFPGHVPSPKS